MGNPHNGKDDMVFNYETTQRASYRIFALEPSKKTLYKPKTPKIRDNSYLVRDSETLTRYDGKKVPFDLFWKPKDILRTKPTDEQQYYEKPIDTEKSKVQHSRPRVVMTPAVSLDAMTDDRERDIVVRDMYQSCWTHDAKEALSEAKIVRAPLPKLLTVARPIRLPPLNFPIVPKEFRRESITWDGRQHRSFVDRDKAFWKNQDIYKLCPSCGVSKSQKNLLPSKFCK